MSLPGGEFPSCFIVQFPTCLSSFLIQRSHLFWSTCYHTLTTVQHPVLLSSSQCLIHWSHLQSAVSPSPLLLTSFLATSNSWGDTPNIILSLTSLKTILIFVKKKKKSRRELLRLHTPSSTNSVPTNSAFYLMKIEASLLILKATLPTFSLHSLIPSLLLKDLSPTNISSFLHH